MSDEVLTAVQDLKPIAEELGLTMAQLAVAWVLQNDNVAAALVGASRPEQVAENVKAAGVKLDADVMKRIDEALGDVVVRDPARPPRGCRRPAPSDAPAHRRTCGGCGPGSAGSRATSAARAPVTARAARARRNSSARQSAENRSVGRP